MQDTPSYEFLMGFCAALANEEVAYTICQRVDISETIIDGRIVAATPAAARLFERDDLHTGTIWQSQTQPIESFRSGWKLSLARRGDHGIPSRYITQIVNGRGEPIDVIKSTTEVLHGSYRFWVTRLDLASTDPNTADVYKIVEGFQNFEECERALCVAEINILIHNLFQGKNLLTNTESVSILQNRITEGVSKIGANLSQARESGEPALGQTYVSRSGKVRVPRVCKKCHYAWMGRSPKRPPQCPDCGDLNWDRDYVVGPRESKR